MTTIQECQEKKKGAFYKIKLNSQKGILAKGKSENLIKIVEMCIRTGINRNNIEFVKAHPVEKSDNGREFWGVYINDRIIKHKEKDAYYLKGYLKQGSFPKTTYYLNGIEVDKEWLKENNYISKSTSSEYNEVGDLFLPLENLTFA